MRRGAVAAPVSYLRSGPRSDASVLFNALKEILEPTFVEAARSKGSDGLGWLNRHKSEMIFLAKQNTEEMSLEDEAKDASGLIQVLPSGYDHSCDVLSPLG